MKPSIMPVSSRTTPRTQLVSRGRRNAPVKNVRIMCAIIAAT